MSTSALNTSRRRPSPVLASTNTRDSRVPVPQPSSSTAHTLSILHRAQELQRAQQEYFNALSLSIQAQSQILLQQQQVEADAAYREMSRSARPDQRGFSPDPRAAPAATYRRRPEQHADPPRSAFVSGRFASSRDAQEEQHGADHNPLVASALARRKRQSFNGDGSHAAAQLPVVSLPSARTVSARPTLGHRSSSSFDSTALSSRSSSKSSHTPPALILSKPGDPYPTTSGSEGEDDAAVLAAEDSQRLRTASASSKDSSSIPKGLSNAKDSPSLDGGAEKDSKRRSHVNTLELALGGRRQRPASIGSAIGHLTSTPVEVQPRSVSDSSALSPFATTFTPLPPSPFTASPRSFEVSTPVPNAPVSTRPLPPSGTATACRQPRGPTTDLSGNWASRVRQQAVATLVGLRIRGNNGDVVAV